MITDIGSGKLGSFSVGRHQRRDKKEEIVFLVEEMESDLLKIDNKQY